MKRIPALCFLLLATAHFSVAAEPSTAPDPQMVAAMKEIQAQQMQIADNQAKIEAKMATIVEAVRVARIYASRSGH